MSFFKHKGNLYPLIAISSSLLIMVFGLLMARDIRCSYFLIGALVWMILFGCHKQCIKSIACFLVIGGIFSTIAYFAANKNPEAALAMANRFGAIFLALVPGMKIQAVAMTRNLSQLKTPRSVTLGMLITMSFVPILSSEISRVREAMKTRGAGSILNLRIFYRAFLIPLVTRIVDISDTLSLSIETRGFTLSSSRNTVYKREVINFYDILFIFGLAVCAVMVVIL